MHPRLNNAQSERKLRLYGVALCRPFAHLLEGPARKALAIAEQFVEGLATAEERAKVRRAAYRVLKRHEYGEAMHRMEYAVLNLLNVRVWPGLRYTYGELASYFARYKQEQCQDWRQEANLLAEEILGPDNSELLAIPQVWRTSNVVSIASAIYQNKKFDDLPILADALEETGCDSSEILDHCRVSTLHVRGCWVIDLVLGKA